MILPVDLQEKINGLYQNWNKKKLTETRRALTSSYKTKTGTGKSHISSDDDSVIYAISRMPATFVVTKTLLNSLIDQNYVNDVFSVIDIGAGTGAGYFAVKEMFPSAKIDLFEREQAMIDVFKQLSGSDAITKCDILSNFNFPKADLVMSSYVLSEMTEENRVKAVKKMLEMTNKYVLLIDTGTPQVYSEYMKIKELVYGLGYNVVAPCALKNCALRDDYCQFYARLERSSLIKMAKDACMPYEDEKFFYLLIGKDEIQSKTPRVIRRPVIATNNVSLTLCSSDGVRIVNFTKKNKEKYKMAKKLKINDIIRD